jgi:A118 family predicted phage portal protein
MLSASTIKQALHLDVAITPRMMTALQLWALMYENRAHWLNDEVKTMNLPASIAGEIARSVTIEMKVKIDGSARAKFLTDEFSPILREIRKQVEYGVAKGGLMMKPYVTNGHVAVDFIQADMFYPLSYDHNGNITSCVFADQRVIGNMFYNRLEMHTMTEEGCVIKNLAFKAQNKDIIGVACPLSEVEEWSDLQPEATITGIDRPLFAYFRYPAANQIDPTSPLGVSCFSRAVELIEEADRVWSDLLWEFESGKRALYVDVLAFGKDKNGLPILPNKRLYRTLNQGGEVSDEEMFHEWSPEFRNAAIQSGLDTILKKIEFVSGLAYGTISDPQTVDKTATEIKISRQRSYATVTDTQKSLQQALDGLLWAMDTWATISGIAPRGSYTATYDFDDSVVTDKETQMTQDRQAVTMGMMPKYVFLMRNYGMDEAAAKDWISQVQSETAPQDVFAGA